MLHLTTSQFDEVYGPHAHVSTVKDIGAVRIDLAGDQPPYIGLVFELEHRQLVGAPFKQLFKVPDAVVLELFHLLAGHIGAADIDSLEGH